MSVQLTIDGRAVAVEEGVTLLQAARRLGIEVPTLCYLDGLEPVGSCFLCVVAVEGRPGLVPSCVAPAEDGMVVATDSPDIRAARKMALELLLSEHTGDCEAPCTLACPAGLDIPGFIRHVAAGRYRQAVALIKERIPLAGALGRVCPRFCERACRRRELDEPVAICALKRFAADADLATHDVYVPTRAGASGRRVAIVGAGPAGLCAAWFLLQAGHACTVFDDRPEPGGLLRYAIPEFRLPADALDGDIDPVRRSGALLRRNVRVGEDLGLDELRRDFDAVFVATGAPVEPPPECQGGGLAISALQFLRSVATGAPPELAGGLVVLGGGNEAIDAARCGIRLGAKGVTVVWEQDRRAMAAFGEWIDAAVAEGVRLECLARPVRIERGQSGLSVLCERQGQRFALEGACIVHAPPRRVDTALADRLGLPTSRRGIQVDRRTLATPVAGVFAGGECVTGPSASVRAVAAGRLAAVSIHQFLSGREVVGEPRAVNVRMGKLSESEVGVLRRTFGERERARMPTLDLPRRQATSMEVERGLPEGAAASEAGRCLQCDCIARDTCKLRRYAAEYGARVDGFKGERRRFDVDDSHPAVVYETGKCILCGLCVRIAEQAGASPGMTFRRRGFATEVCVPFGEPVADALGDLGPRCAAACPTGALALRRELEPASDAAAAPQIPDAALQVPDGAGEDAGGS